MLFFRANDGFHGRELGTSKGTSAGTHSVRDIFPGKRHSDPRVSIESGGGRELWISDASDAGTREATDRNESGGSALVALVVHDGGILFAGDDGPSGTEGFAPPTGAALVADVDLDGNIDARDAILNSRSRAGRAALTGQVAADGDKDMDAAYANRVPEVKWGLAQARF